MDRIIAWCDTHLIDNWRTEWRRLWSVRFAVFWIVVAGVVALLPMISDEVKELVGAKTFATIFLLGFVSVGVARYLKQPGADQ